MAPDMAFGPAGDQWLYNRSSATYDLSRGASNTYIVATDPGPKALQIEVDPAKSALVIVDMQNFFLHPSCRQHQTGLAAVQPTLEVIERCREIGIQIIWLNWGLTDADLASMPAAIQRSFAASLTNGEKVSSATGQTESPAWPGLGADMGSGKGRCLMAGSWNAQIYEGLLPAVREKDDVFCAKNRMSGMWSPEQPLWRHLKQAGKKTLFFTGVNTDQCVLGTLVDAYNAGWDCVLIEDCAATTTQGAAAVCADNITRCYGFVVDSLGFCGGKLRVERQSSGQA